MACDDGKSQVIGRADSGRVSPPGRKEAREVLPDVEFESGKQGLGRQKILQEIPFPSNC